MSKLREDIRNIAIIAHVDHGKTTLVDAMLRQSGIFRVNEKVTERVMDSNDLEREKGITIMSKNTAVLYNGIHINIVDTPGHADFGGEVERILKMVEGVLLLVDAYEGPMPQTRFVLKKALALNLKPIVVINKIDRKEARCQEVIDDIIGLFIELEANDNQLEFPVIYASGRDGYASAQEDGMLENLTPLFDSIVKFVPPPKGEVEAPFQLLISSIDYDEYVGRIAIGKIERGMIEKGDKLIVCRKGDVVEPVKIASIQVFKGLKRVTVEKAQAGEIVSITGIEDITIGETICDAENPEPLPFVELDEPTISMQFLVNNSPFAGTEGTYVTSRHLRDRLYKEKETNLSLRIEETNSPDSFNVSGRGELHLSILIETMRREGYEFQVSKPEVITKSIDGVLYEPIEYVTTDVPEEYMGAVMEELGSRKGELVNMRAPEQGFSRLEYKIPSRALIGFRSRFLTTTRGNGIMNHIFDGYEPYKGEVHSRDRGSIIAWETGEAVTYGLYNAQERGTLFIGPGQQVYEGMVVGESARIEDIVINVCKKKHVTNIRAAGSDDALKLVPIKVLSLEACLEFIADDELVEVTPKSIRLRKKILNSTLRAKAGKKKEK
ncbi:MAG TPA: translational GTPase TypA [Thermoclostridium sp.]|nr:translational GTPase TypA [Thermoclostridium sp.]